MAQAYATAKPGAPDGKQTRAAVDHSWTLRLAAACEAASWSGTKARACASRSLSARAEAPRHSAGALHERITPASDQGPDASGWKDWRRFGVGVSLANAGNKTPPGFQSEGVRVASEDRGNRSPACAERSVGAGTCVGVRKSVRRAQRIRAAAFRPWCRIAGDMGEGFHRKARFGKNAARAKVADNTPAQKKKQAIFQQFLKIVF